MRRFHCAALAAVAVVGFASMASAADMPLKAPSAPAPIYNWTGFYIGGSLGAAFGNHQWDSANNFGQPGCGVFGCAPFGTTGPLGASYDFTSLLGGGRLGANYQIGSMVLGIEGGFDWIGKTAFAAACNQPLPQPPFIGPGAITRCQSTTRWLASATARIGYAWDSVLPYVRGGVAWARDLYEFGHGEAFALPSFPQFQTEITRAGWTVGAGVEYTFVAGLSTFFEYDYYDFGTQQVDLAATPIIAPYPSEPMKIGLQIHTVKVGLSYLFH